MSPIWVLELHGGVAAVALALYKQVHIQVPDVPETSTETDQLAQTLSECESRASRPHRSATGCLACKIKHKKCDEAKPHCLRCQKSCIECPGYTYTQDPNNPNRGLRTLSAPRTVAGRSRGTARQRIPLVITEEPDPQLQDQSLLDYGPITSRARVTISNLGPPRDLDSPPQRAQTTTYLLMDPIIPMVLSWPPPDIEQQINITSHEDGYPEGVVASIRPELVLDRTVESNALPFVLQSYATWISRVAFEPQKLMHTSREFVCSHFGDGEQSRWIIALLANVGSRIGSVDVMESSPTRMISLLQDAVRRRLEAVKSSPKPKKGELVKALDSALETMVIHFHISPVSEVTSLIQEATPIFRQLCPEPHGEAINLNSLLQHPLGCLRRFAQLDLSFSIISDLPTAFRYEAAIADIRPSNPYSSLRASQSEGVLQWLHGIPNPILLLLARMKAMRQDGLIPNGEAIASLERDIRDSQSFNSSSSEPFLGIMRFVVHECWRQAVCLFVQQAISPAALRKRDRQVLRQRVLGLYSRDQTYVANTWIIFVIDAVWARTDAEGRPTTWSDFAMPHTRVVNVETAEPGDGAGLDKGHYPTLTLVRDTL
ncbi:hypothetical protein B0J17DRAFT_702894 [Rhizoctonia solani]|nr:hypothetical protein B0J17DRAFT_702894 [Rhizoctonia solani]